MRGVEVERAIWKQRRSSELRSGGSGPRALPGALDPREIRPTFEQGETTLATAREAERLVHHMERTIHEPTSARLGTDRRYMQETILSIRSSVIVAIPVGSRRSDGRCTRVHLRKGKDFLKRRKD